MSCDIMSYHLADSILGLTAGRLVLHYVTRTIPERNTIFVYAILSIGCVISVHSFLDSPMEWGCTCRLELTIWLVPSLIGNAVSVSLIGFLLGPLYPAVMNQAVC